MPKAYSNHTSTQTAATTWRMFLMFVIGKNGKPVLACAVTQSTCVLGTAHTQPRRAPPKQHVDEAAHRIASGQPRIHKTSMTCLLRACCQGKDATGTAAPAEAR